MYRLHNTCSGVKGYALSLLLVSALAQAAPTAGPDGALNLPEDFGTYALDVAGNFTFTDAPTYSLISVDGAAATVASFDAAAGAAVLESVDNASGEVKLVFQAENGLGTAQWTLALTVDGVNDTPLARDDDAEMNVGGVRQDYILIDVLANDDLGDEPVSIVELGVGGFSESPPTTVLEPNGDPVSEPNASLAVELTPEGPVVRYDPKEGYSGDDFFTYTIQDVDGERSTATVRVAVRHVNTPPVVNRASTQFTVFSNNQLDVGANLGLLYGAYDVDGALLGPDGVPAGATLTANVVTAPLFGLLDYDPLDGSFTYTPPGTGFPLDVSIVYRISDGTDWSQNYVIEIRVTDPPLPPAPPPPGEVAITYNLAQVPLEQTSSVPPNVLVMMDDSGSMDWNMSVAGADENGGFILNNDPVANSSNRRSTSYYYLYGLSSNIFGNSTANGRVLPTQAIIVSRYGNAAANHHQVWRARNAAYNRLYYNPLIRYTPWVGHDTANNEFADADPASIRLNPRNPSTAASNRINILNNHTYRSTNVPRWANSSTLDAFDVTVYIPYYHVTATDVVEIRSSRPTYPGGPRRDDCANPMVCTYAEEIQNFANWFQYYRTREYAAKNSLGKVIARVQDVRVGYDTINQSVSRAIAPMNDLFTEGNKRALLNTLYSGSSSGGTPLRAALQRAGEMYSAAPGAGPVLPAPEGLCQQNFTLLFSDGYWNEANTLLSGIGNQDSNTASPFDGGRYADTFSNTLADVAMRYYKNDLQPGMENLVPAGQRDILGAPSGTFGTGTARMHQHMKTYTVAFGVTGSIDPATVPTNPATAFAWPNPTASSAGKIDDMLHAAVNARGQYLSAVSPQELQTALETAFLEFTQAASSSSAAAFNSTSLQEGTLLYRGFYDLRTATGELTATRVNEQGVLEGAPIWRASDELDDKTPDARVLVSYDPASSQGIAFRAASLTANQLATLPADLIAYLRGTRSNELQNGGLLRDRPSQNGLLGDIVNSSPVFVGRPRALNRDQVPYPLGANRYSNFATDFRTRQELVYVGANDGMLHGFDARTGEELFGFVPNKLLDATRNYRNPLNEFTEPLYQHKFYVDLTPRLNDVFMRASRATATKSWNTLLVGGLGAGGKGFYGLNITNPNNFGSEFLARNTVLWEFTDEDDSYAFDPADPLILDPLGLPVKDLGFAMSLPTTAMSNVNDGAGADAQKEWVAIFGNGPNSTAGVAKLFVLFVDRGLDGWTEGTSFVKLDTGFGVPGSGPLTGLPNGLGSPTAVDVDLNGTADWVYAGDRQGNLFRFDIRDANPDNWTVTRLFTATYTDGGVTRPQPILSQPLVVKHPSEAGFMVIFGTGSFITRDDADNEEIQTIYAIWDHGADNPPTALANTRDQRLVRQVMTNVVDAAAPTMVRRTIQNTQPVPYRRDTADVPGVYGWYIDLDLQRAVGATDTTGRNPPSPQFPGEKAIRQFVSRGSAVVTTTVLPSLDEFSCFGTRPGAVLVFDALTGGDIGQAIIDFNQDGVIDEGDLVKVGDAFYSGGLLFNQTDLDGQLVDLSTLGGQGGIDFLFVSGGSDTITYLISNVDDGRTGRLSWRELDTQE